MHTSLLHCSSNVQGDEAQLLPQRPQCHPLLLLGVRDVPASEAQVRLTGAVVRSPVELSTRQTVEAMGNENLPVLEDSLLPPCRRYEPRGWAETEGVREERHV